MDKQISRQIDKWKLRERKDPFDKYLGTKKGEQKMEGGLWQVKKGNKVFVF